MRNKNQQWLEDYKTFLLSENTVVPKQLSGNIFSQLQKLINPSPWFVFLKVLGIHIVIGFLSLSLCHQFGMNPFNTEASLSEWMMSMGGHSVCMIGCGIFFVGLSLALAGYFLSIEEVRALKRTEFLQTFALGTISLAIFSIVGAEMALTISGLWLLGALIGGFVATEAVWKLKRVHAFVKPNLHL